MSLTFVVKSDVIFNAHWVVIFAIRIGIATISTAILEHWEWAVLEWHTGGWVGTVSWAGAWVFTLAWLVAEKKNNNNKN